MAHDLPGSNENALLPQRPRIAHALQQAVSPIIDNLELHLTQIRSEGHQGLDATISECEQVLSEIRRHIGELDNS